MHAKIRTHVEYLFQPAPHSPRAVELKEEMIAGLIDKYDDLLRQGETEEAAYGIAIAGIGDIDELIQGLREQELWSPAGIQAQRQKSALLVSVAVGLFIASLIFPTILGYFSRLLHTQFFSVIGFSLMILCIATGVGLLVYNQRSKPRYIRADESMVEDFKEWKVSKENRAALSNTIQSIIYIGSVPLYLFLGIFLGMWHPGWLIFLLAPLLGQIVRLVFIYKEAE